MPVISLDSDVLIASLSPNEEHSEIARQLIQAVAAGVYTAFASCLVYGEVLSVKESKSQELDLPLFLKKAKVTVHNIDTDLCLMAGQLRQRNNPALKLPDAIHLATAITYLADIFITNDESLAKKANNLIYVVRLSDCPKLLK